MPAVGALVAAAISQISIGQIIFNIAMSFIMSALTSLFQDKPKRNLQDRQEMIRSGVEPRRVIYGEVRVSGPMVYATSSGSGNKSLHLVVVLASHSCESVEGVWLDTDELELDANLNVIDAKYANNVKLNFHMGDPDQVADADLIAASGGEWTSEHRLRGQTYLHIELIYNGSIFPAGIPVPRVLLKGKNTIYDPRDGLNKYTDNWALCEADYITAKIGVGAPWTEINEPTLIASANVSDETVTTLNGTEKRYVVNGTLEADTPREDAINSMLSAGMGAVVYAGGQFHIYAGGPKAATLTITEDDLAGPVRVSPRISRDQLFNTVRGIFANKDDLYQSVDYPIISNATYVAEDNGEEIVKSLNFDFTTSTGTVQRLAGIALARSRQQISVNLTCNIRMLRVQAWDTVFLTLEEFGWSAKKFRIESWAMNEDQTISLVLREEADVDWNWNYANDEVIQDPSPDTSFDSPFNHGQVTYLTATSGSDLITVASDGSLNSQMKISWTPPDQSETVVVGFKKAADTDFEYAQIIPGSRSVIVGPVTDSVLYDIEVTSFNGIGVSSPAVAITHLVVGKAGNPGDVDQFTISVQPDGTREFNVVHLQPEADVRVGGGYHIPYAPGPTIDLDTADSLNTGKITSWPWENNQLPAGEYTFACRVEDSTGNVSQNPKIITATLPDPRMRNAVAAWNEKSLGWPGIKTDCFVNYENELEASAAQAWDDLGATWDALAGSWSGVVTSKSPIKYETEVYDINSDVSVTPLVGVGAIGTVAIKMRTATDAAGSDLSALSYIDTAQVTCRYIQFEITVTGTTPVIKTLTPILDGEILINDQGDINTALASAGTFEKIATGHFKVGVSRSIASITSAQIVAKQNVGSGWSDELISKSTTLLDGTPAAEFKLYNSAGALADAIIDVTLKGPKA